MLHPHGDCHRRGRGSATAIGDRGDWRCVVIYLVDLAGAAFAL